MYGFTLDNKVSSQSLGLRLTAPVEIPASQRVVEDVEVAGRAGTLTRFNGWSDLTISLSLAIEGGITAYQHATHTLTCAKTVSFTGEAQAYRRIKHVQVEPLRRELSTWGAFDVRLVCEPFTYLKSGLETITVDSDMTITNPGLLPCAPVITIEAIGDASFTINNHTYQAFIPGGELTIDSSRLVTHVAGKLQTDALTGQFPTLQPGDNKIKLGAGVMFMDIQGNWRNP